jgi:hypothetical protein
MQLKSDAKATFTIESNNSNSLVRASLRTHDSAAMMNMTSQESTFVFQNSGDGAMSVLHSSSSRDVATFSPSVCSFLGNTLVSSGLVEINSANNAHAVVASGGHLQDALLELVSPIGQQAQIVFSTADGATAGQPASFAVVHDAVSDRLSIQRENAALINVSQSSAWFMGNINISSRTLVVSPLNGSAAQTIDSPNGAALYEVWSHSGAAESRIIAERAEPSMNVGAFSMVHQNTTPHLLFSSETVGNILDVSHERL